MNQYTVKRHALWLSAPLRRAWDRQRHRGGPDALFIWIPKSAGTSVFTALGALGMRKFKSLEKARHLFPNRGMATFSHLSVAMLANQRVIDPDYVRRAFKFAIVRNPYDRCLSLYRYFVEMGRYPCDFEFPVFLYSLQKGWENYRDTPPPPLSEMSDRLRYYGESIGFGNAAVWPVGLYNALDWSQCRPQCEWLDGVPAADDIFLGRIESIDVDFAEILRRLRELDPHLPAAPAAVPRLNTTRRPAGDDPYRKDPALRRIVETIYQSDFERFSY